MEVIILIINERIKEMRNARNFTLLEVAEKLGVKEATMQRYESGEIKNIKHETIVKLADIFNCSPVYLMGWSNRITGTENQNLPPLAEQIEKEYGKAAASALSLFVQLDELDRLRVNERMQTLLENEKYSSKPKKELSNA